MSQVTELFKDAKALMLDVATAPFRAPAELYKALRRGYDVIGDDLKGSFGSVPAPKEVVSQGKNQVVAALLTTGSELFFKASIGVTMGAFISSLSHQNVVIGAIVGGAVTKVLTDVLCESLCDRYAGTGTPTFPHTRARSKVRAPGSAPA